MPGSEKIRRIVEVLRADVIQGLGVQLLEQVYDLLEEEDELKREVSVLMTVSNGYVIKSFKRTSEMQFVQVPYSLLL